MPHYQIKTRPIEIILKTLYLRWTNNLLNLLALSSNVCFLINTFPVRVSFHPNIVQCLDSLSFPSSTHQGDIKNGRTGQELINLFLFADLAQR
jgi:hypothetical protein